MKDLDLMLKELRATEPYVDDHGFTAVVMAQLPVQRELPLWFKNLLLIGATLIGSAVAALQLPDSLGSLLLGMTRLPALDVQPLLAAASQNLPLMFVACLVVSYVVPFGAMLAVRRTGL